MNRTYSAASTISMSWVTGEVILFFLGIAELFGRGVTCEPHRADLLAR